MRNFRNSSFFFFAFTTGIDFSLPVRYIIRGTYSIALVHNQIEKLRELRGF